MADFSMTVNGLDEAIDGLDKLQRLKNFKTGLEAAALHLKGKFATYPAQKRLSRKAVYGKTFVSVKQQRFVFAAIKRGDIPYVRGTTRTSETLGRRWATEARRGGLEQVIGNNASYVQHVMGENQSRYMQQVGWQKMTDIAKNEKAMVNRIVQSYARRDLP